MRDESPLVTDSGSEFWRLNGRSRHNEEIEHARGKDGPIFATVKCTRHWVRGGLGTRHSKTTRALGGEERYEAQAGLGTRNLQPLSLRPPNAVFPIVCPLGHFQ